MSLKLWLVKLQSRFGLWYRSHKDICIEKNGSYRHIFLEVIAMDLLKKLIIACVIGSYPLIFFAGRWVEFTQFKLFCYN